MTVVELFSKRQRREQGEVPDVYVYDSLPHKLRVQITYIVRDAFGHGRINRGQDNAYELVQDILCREHGLLQLVQYSLPNVYPILKFLLEEESIEQVLDAIDLCFRVIDTNIRHEYPFLYGHTPGTINPDHAILTLNERFKENGVGYQFESSKLIRIDSEFLHAEAIKPTLKLLSGEDFKGANDEFLLAHEHYRHGRHKGCLVNSLAAFESTMKAICKIRGWESHPTDTASKLIRICTTQGILPPYLDSQMSSYRSLLESGVPTLRNKNGGHGQGVDPIIVPEYIARYGLNLTATNILFLVEAHDAK